MSAPPLLILCLLLCLPSDVRAEDTHDVQTLAFVGDVSVAGRRVPKNVRGAANPLAAFREVFERADVAVANVEGLLTKERPKSYSRSRLDIGASPVWAPIFADAHIDLVGLANNHTWDGGAAGLLEHQAHLTRTGVQVMGAAADADAAAAPARFGPPGACLSVIPATIKSNRPRRLGAHAAYYRGAKEHRRLLDRVTTEAKGCLTTVYIHWGREAVHSPPKSVQALARKLIDAGATLVVGHHPHVLQGVEFYGRGAIAYSLGNFVFTNRTLAKRQTGVLVAQVRPGSAGQLVALKLLPAVISVPGFSPAPATAAQAKEIARLMRDYSGAWGTRVRLEDDEIVFEPPARSP